MKRQLVLLALLVSLCGADFVQLRIQEPEVLPGFRQRVFVSDGGQQVLSSMHSPINPMPMTGQPLFGGMQQSTNGNWDAWMDSQFDALQAMNQAVLGRRGGCGGHLQRASFGPILIRGVPSMTTPSAVMQRLATARFGNDLLKALIESQVRAEVETSDGEPAFDQDEAALERDYAQEIEDAALEAGAEELAWEDSERMLRQEDQDEEAAAEADAIETTQAQWASLMPTWLAGPEDQELIIEPAPSAVNWSLYNEDGSTNWGLVVFIIQATACAAVWVGLVATLGWYRFARRRCSSIPMSASDSHLMTPLMYEPPSKAGNAAQLYEDLYHVEDAKLHADDRQYVAIQYAPLKTEK